MTSSPPHLLPLVLIHSANTINTIFKVCPTGQVIDAFSTSAPRPRILRHQLLKQLQLSSAYHEAPKNDTGATAVSLEINEIIARTKLASEPGNAGYAATDTFKLPVRNRFT